MMFRKISRPLLLISFVSLHILSLSCNPSESTKKRGDQLQEALDSTLSNYPPVEEIENSSYYDSLGHETWSLDTVVQGFLDSIILNDSNIGREEIRSFSDSSIYEVRAHYLGIISNESAGLVKVLNVTHYTGILQDAKRAKCDIHLYRDDNQYIGKYYVGGILSLPERIVDNRFLRFLPDGRCTEETNIDFSIRIPAQIFIRCSSEAGDLYPFVPSRSFSDESSN